MVTRLHKIMFTAFAMTGCLIGGMADGVYSGNGNAMAQVSQTTPPDPGVSLSGYPGIVAGYQSMERGYATKNPALVAAVWSPLYKRLDREGGKTTATDYAKALAELKHEFPGNRTEAGYYSPTQYFLPQSVHASADGSRVTIAGVCYAITPNSPQDDPHCKEGNSCGSHPFTHVWSRPKSGSAWLLLADERGAESEAADNAIGMFVNEAVDEYHQRAGLVGRARPEGGARRGGNAAQIRAANDAAFQAAFKGDMKLLQKLFDEGADVKMRDKSGKTLLHYAAMGGRVELAKWLLAQGAELNARDAKGATPLALAREDTQDAKTAERRAELISFLAEKGAAE